MTVTELALVVIALAAACTGGAAVVVAMRVGAATRHIEPLILDMRVTLKRINGIAGDLEHVVHDARRLEERLNVVVEGPVRTAAALVQGLGAGLASLVFRRSGTKDPSPPRDGPGHEGMTTPSRPTSAEGGRS